MQPVHTDPLHPDSVHIEAAMLNLRPTQDIIGEIEDTLQRLDNDPNAPHLKHLLSILQVELHDGEMRDELEVGRPPGCWCLGLGGTGAVMVDVPLDPPAKAVWRICCAACDEGREAAMRAEQASVK